MEIVLASLFSYWHCVVFFFFNFSSYKEDFVEKATIQIIEELFMYSLIHDFFQTEFLNYDVR